MGLRFKLNLLPSLLAGERVLYFKNFLWLVSNSSWPNYRIFFPLPPVFEAGIYITDRRILFVSTLLRTVSEEFDLWFENSSLPPDTEIIKEISLGKSLLLGPYLEIVSQNSKKMWYRSSQVRLRVYLKDAEYIHKIASDAILDINFWTT